MPQLMKTSNPALSSRVFRSQPMALGESMTIDGTVNKTGILLLLTAASAAWTWHLSMSPESAASVPPLMLVGVIGGLIFAMVTVFKAAWSPFTAPVYALLEGLLLGGISAVLNVRFPGIAIQAVGLTFGTLFVMLVAYRTHIIPVTQKFKLGIVAATGAIMLFYVAQWILGFFGMHFGAINGNGTLGIAFSVVVVIVAALNLVLDFDFIETGARSGTTPKYMEWYGAFGLMVTLVWLYLEMLRLLAKTRSR